MMLGIDGPKLPEGLEILPDFHIFTASRNTGAPEPFIKLTPTPTSPRSPARPPCQRLQKSVKAQLMSNTPTAHVEADIKEPITPMEAPPSPPRAYDPHSVERAGHPSQGEPITAVNSFTLEEGSMSKEGRSPAAGFETALEQPKPPAQELPLVVRPFSAKARQYLMAEVDTNIASLPLSAYCFMTGYTDAITYTACYVWSAFQTGNTIQCAMAIAKLFSAYPHPVTENPWPTTMPEEAKWNPLAAEQWVWRRDTGLKTGDAQALVSLLAFLFGAFCGRFGDHIGPRRRVWLMSNTFIQAGFTLASALCAWADGESSFAGARGSEFANWGTPLGFCALGFASAAMGLQAHAGVRIGNIFNSSVVLTTIWVQFVGEPKLFQPHKVKQRDHKAVAILGLVLGGMIGRALINVIGAPWTLGLGAGIRVLIALSWLTIPAAKPKSK
ncbi:hypothetical protein CTheo_2783 [Ceratobasidium theobromae]|uniref:Uncharacterized protein n=1 Tax=Ceratobasidium theobromae TaxID=1582974 RepID=A0A5N5QQ34_9AGAM|nr:hypothetical protein CTheo_2783 [Ceratobasidium theobromae]